MKLIYSFVVGIFLFMNSVVAFADASLPAAQDREVFSNNKKFVAVMSVKDNRTVIYKMDKNGNRVKMWEMSGWSRWSTLSNDGEYLAIPYEGMNLLPLQYKKDEVMLIMVKEGKKIWDVKLNELISNFELLPRTSSHFYWGDCMGFNDNGEYRIKTAEGNDLFVDIETGEISKRN